MSVSLTQVESIENVQQPTAAELGLLFEALQSNDVEVVDVAVTVLEDCGPPHPEAVQFVARQIDSGNHADVVFWCCTLLGRLENPGVEISNVLAALIDDSKTPLNVRNRAVAMLKKLETKV